MSITLNDGTILRNLEEQVQYLTNYHDVNQGLAQWGIRVVGQVSVVGELPDPATYDGEYGDTYAVGFSAPYNFYIWTRASIVGDPGYWFPFGNISIVGPQGPQGEQGEKGDTGLSSRWYTGSTPPAVGGPGDIWLESSTYFPTGDIFTWNSDSQRWERAGNIRGPQGIQGIQGPPGADGKDGEQGPPGPQGDVGGFINIWGILANVEQLPTPASLNNLTVAYLVAHAGGSDAANDHYDLYIQVGESSDTAIWNNAGPFNAATLVTSEGVGLNVWDADTKLDKVTTTTSTNQVYIKNASGGQAMLPVSNSVVSGAVVNRTQDGHILVPTVDETSNLNYVANKNYVDNKFLAKVTGLSQVNQAYVKTTAGNQEMFPVTTDIYNNAIVRRSSDGDVYVNNVPISPYGAVNKNYVNDSFVPKVTSTDGTKKAYIANASGGQSTINVTGSVIGSTIVQRVNDGGIQVSTQITNGNYAISKGQCDNTYLTKPADTNNGVVRFNATDGTTSVYTVYQSVPPVAGSAIPLCKANGRLVVGTPVDGVEAVNLNYISLVSCSIIIGGETFDKDIPAYLKNEPSAYVGAVCSTHAVRHVIMGYDKNNDEFVIYDMSDESSTMKGDYTIEQ